MILRTSTAFLASAGLASAAAVSGRATMQQNCQGTSFEEGGNWYCRAVQQVVYQGIGTTGQYQQVTSMDASTGKCEYASASYSGPVAPFDEPLSVHLRGPIALKQFAWYTPSTTSAATAKREDEDAGSSHKHGKRSRHRHQRHHEIDGRANESRDTWVTVTMNGQVVSWTNDYFGPSSSSSSSSPLSSTTDAPALAATTSTPSTTTAQATATVPTQTPPAHKIGTTVVSGTGSGGFVRAGYYSASTQDVEGLTFLGNFGGQGSGKWTSKFGNTLSYVNASGTGGASGPQILADTVVPSGNEFAIMTNETCDATSCGYVLDGSVAYKGFPGATKLFLFEFAMPHEPGATGLNADMPALWLLNARIPYTGQYGPCSCWASGCGELDVFEVLAPGDAKCKSTVHAAPGRSGGDSDYFVRPGAGVTDDGTSVPSDAIASETVKVAVVFDAAAGAAYVTVVDDMTEFAASLEAKQVQAFVADPTGVATSDFVMGGGSSS